MKFNWWSLILVGIALVVIGRFISGLIGDTSTFIGVVMVLVGLLTGYRLHKANKNTKKPIKK